MVSCGNVVAQKSHRAQLGPRSGHGQGPLLLVKKVSMEVTVKTLTGKSFSVHICPSETIAAGWWFGFFFSIYPLDL